MNRLKYSMAAVVVMALSACGGQSPNHTPIDTEASSPLAASAPTSASAPVTASSPASSPVSASAPGGASSPAVPPVVASVPVISIDARGDGALMGITSENPFPTITPQSEPADLQALLQKQFADTGLTVNNLASGGTASTLQDELDGMDGMGPPLPQRLAQSTAAIEIEQHGSGDMLGGESLSDYQGYLVQWVQYIQASGKIGVLEEPGPQCGNVNPQLPAYVAIMDAVAKQYGIPLITQYQPILALAGWESHMDSTCQFPDATLDQFKAAQEQAVIGLLVKKLIGE